tara:strand:- start:62 stop:346 length:285 start_codon:yes stop_codon:yes gene_type:complete
MVSLLFPKANRPEANSAIVPIPSAAPAATTDVLYNDKKSPHVAPIYATSRLSLPYDSVDHAMGQRTKQNVVKQRGFGMQIAPSAERSISTRIIT